MNHIDSVQGAYRLRVTGSSMAPRIKLGELVQVDPGQEYHRGDEVVVCTRGGQTVLGLFTHWRDGQVRLDNVNPDYEPIFLPEDEVECVHAIVGIERASRRERRPPDERR